MTKMNSPAVQPKNSDQKRTAQGHARSQKGRSVQRRNDDNRRTASLAKPSRSVVAPRLQHSTDHRALATAKRALAAAKNVSEALKIRALSAGLRAAASVAKDRTLEIEAAELHVRTTRKLGELMAAQAETIGMAKGTAGMGRPKKGGIRRIPPKDKPTLDDNEIGKTLARHARAVWRLSEEVFEENVTKWRKHVEGSLRAPATNLLWKAILRATKGEQLDWVGHSRLDLSRSQEKIERVLEENELSPDHLKLDETSAEIITIVAETTRKLKTIAARIDQPGATTEFQKEFAKMAERVAELADQYRALAKWLADRDRDDARRAGWPHSDIQPYPPEDEPPEPDPDDEQPPEPRPTGGGPSESSGGAEIPF